MTEQTGMHRIFRIQFLVLWMLLAGSPQAFALACKAIDGTAVIAEQIPENIAVAEDAPDMTVLWESRTYTVNVRCYHDFTPKASAIYMYLNPTGQPLATGTLLGVRFGGQVYTQTDGRVSLGVTIPVDRSVTFAFSFSVLVYKNGAAPSSALAPFNAFRVFQVDGEGGLNVNPDSNINFVVDGNIRFIGCFAVVSPGSDVIDIGKFSAGGIAGTPLKELVFQLNASKACDSSYGLRVKFTPMNSSPSGSLIAGGIYQMDNGIGFSLVDPAVGELPLTFAEYQPFVPIGTWTSAGKDYKATFVRQAPLTAGPFSLDVMIDLEYY